MPDDLMRLGLDVTRVTAVYEHFQRVQRCGLRYLVGGGQSLG
jgi:hypothetical protein